MKAWLPYHALQLPLLLLLLLTGCVWQLLLLLLLPLLGQYTTG